MSIQPVTNQTTLVEVVGLPNVRLSPDTNSPDNILTQILKPSVKFKATRTPDGAWWELIAFISADTNFTRVIGAAGAGSGGSFRAIPHVSQNGAFANKDINDCGKACVAMLARWRGIHINVDDVPFSGKNGYTTNEHLVQNFSHLGLKSTWANVLPGTTGLSYGTIALIWMESPDYTGWHWVVFLHADAQNVYFHDPYFGANTKRSLKEWQTMFAATTKYGALIVRLT